MVRMQTIVQWNRNEFLDIVPFRLHTPTTTAIHSHMHTYILQVAPNTDGINKKRLLYSLRWCILHTHINTQRIKDKKRTSLLLYIVKSCNRYKCSSEFLVYRCTEAMVLATQIRDTVKSGSYLIERERGRWRRECKKTHFNHKNALKIGLSGKLWTITKWNGLGKSPTNNEFCRAIGNTILLSEAS